MIGDVFEQLALLQDETIDCVVTSPPYWGLRDYGIEGQIGLETSLGEHIDTMVKVFRGIKRVLKKTGTCWINYGDCYATSPNGRSADETKTVGNDDRTFRDKPFSTIQGNLKAKDLCMISNRLAIALQDDGWWIRSEIIWHKPNPMPESIKDRPASSHEKIWLITKSERYFYNALSVRIPMAAASLTRLAQDIDNQTGSIRANAGKKINGNMKAVGKGNAKTFRGGVYTENSQFDNSGNQERNSHGNQPNESGTANLKNVWTIATAAFSDAHFATFPPTIPEICITAGCPKDGLVLDPFGGAGTTGLVADRLGRNAILIELNPEYAALANRRISQDNPLFTEIT